MFHARSFETVSDFAGTSADELAILGRRSANLRTRLLVVDASSGQALTTTTVPQLRENPHDLAVVPDFVGSDAEEILLLTTAATDGNTRIYVKDARGRSLGNFLVGEG